MHLILESQHEHGPDAGRYMDPSLGIRYAFDPGVSLLDWASGQALDHDGADRIVLRDWAGHRGHQPDQDAASWIASWSQAGWDRFDSAYRQARMRAESVGIEFLIRPSSDGMLSDAVSTLNWCARGAGQDATLLLDPMGWIVSSMMRDLGDHLDRINELCLEMVEHGRVGLVLLRSVVHGAESGLIESAPLSSGGPTVPMILEGFAGLLEQSPRVALLCAEDLGLLGIS